MNREVVQLIKQGRYAEAITLANQALEVADKTLGPEHPDTAASVNNLGYLYQAMGQYDQALPLYQRAFAILEKVLGSEHPNTATSVNNLGGLYYLIGQYDQALPLFMRALAIREKVLGPEHADTATSLNNLGYLYQAMGQYVQALPLYQRAFAIHEKVLGPEHPDTAASVNNLGGLYYLIGQYDQALPWVATELRRVVHDSKDKKADGIIPGTRYLDNDFTRDVFMGLLKPDAAPSVMHIATHFSLAPGNDNDSELVLGTGEGLKLSVIAASSELSGYELITLSACETALGASGKRKIKDQAVGAEVEGLGAVLQQQGAKAVLATLWKVEDTGTALLMEQFYKLRGEKRKSTKAQALQEAQRSLLDGTVKSDDPNHPDLRHPYYWAPFILMGNWL